MQKMPITAGFWADLIFRQTRTDLFVPIFTPTRWFLVVFLPALFQNLSETWLLVLLERILISRYQHLIPGCRISLTGETEQLTAQLPKGQWGQSCATWRVISTSRKFPEFSELDFALPKKHVTNLHTIPSTQQSHRHLQMLLDFLVEFVKPHFELTERLVAALWRKASGWRVSECTIKSETLTGRFFWNQDVATSNAGIQCTMQKIENLKPTKGESEHWVVRKNKIGISMNNLHR